MGTQNDHIADLTWHLNALVDAAENIRTAINAAEVADVLPPAVIRSLRKHRETLFVETSRSQRLLDAHREEDIQALRESRPDDLLDTKWPGEAWRGS